LRSGVAWVARRRGRAVVLCRSGLNWRDVPTKVADLGHQIAVVRRPSDSVEISNVAIAESEEGVWFWLTNYAPSVAGNYEVRWYGTCGRARYQEIARAKFVVEEDGSVRVHMFVLPDNSYTVTEHDPDKPWLVLGRSHGKVTLEDGASFFVWAAEHWPVPRWSVELDPYQLAPWLR
jgi:hypothetical protein